MKRRLPFLFVSIMALIAVFAANQNVSAFEPQEQTITFGALADKTYGDGDFTVSATATSGLAVSFSAQGNCTVTGDLVHITGAGSCTITASQPGDADWQPAPDVEQSFNIAKATLTVTANDQTVTYGDADPAFSFEYSGFVNGEDASVIDTPPTCSVSGAHTDVGTYPIACSGGLDDNYDFSYVNGTLTVEKATLTVTANDQTITYGDAEPAYTFDYSGFKYSDDASVVDTPPTCGVSGPHTNAGQYTISCSGGADNNYDFDYVDGTLTVEKATLTVTADNKSMQYSDPVPALTYQITGFVNGDTIDVVSGSPVLTTTATSTSAPGDYEIDVQIGTLSADNYVFDPVDGVLTVNPEDARVYYTGTLFVNTPCSTCSVGTATLSVTIRDISAETGDPDTDSFPGDIRNATVTFIDRDTSQVLAADVPVGLVSAADTTTGTATANVNIDLGNSSSDSFRIGIIVGGYYTRDSTDDDTIVTVSKPVGKNFITGGGFLLMTEDSQGVYASTPGTKTNFGFNVKYNKGGKNLQGRVNVIVRSGDRVYQIKGNAMLTLTVDKSDPNNPKAVYTGKANVTDVTDELNPIPVFGNATFKIELTDRGEPGSEDSIGFTLWSDDGGLLYSSRWSSIRTLEQVLGGGNLVVR